MRRVVCCIALAICASAPSVRADDVPADTDDRKKREAAKRYVDAGLAAQDQGDHDTAVALYEKAYALLPHPTLLFNIGQAHRLARRPSPAIEHYHRFLAETTDGKLAEEARRWVAQLEPEAAKEREAAKAAADRAAAEWLAANRVAAADRAADRAAGRAADRAATDQASGASRRGLAATAAGDEASSSPAGGGRGLRIAGAGLAIAGGLVAGGGAAFGLRARRLSDELSRPGAVHDPARIQRGERAERTMYVLYAAGGAAIATGAVLFIVGRRGAGSPRTARVVPAWSGDAVGLAVLGGF